MSNNLYLNNKLLRDIYKMLLYIVSSVLASIVLTIFSMISYHMVLKSQISKDISFECSGGVIASEISAYFEIFGIYLISTLITAYFFSILTTAIVLLIEFLFFWFVFYCDIWYASNRRWLDK